MKGGSFALICADGTMRDGNALAMLVPNDYPLILKPSEGQ